MITKLYSFHHPIQYSLIRLLPRVLPAINCTKVSHASSPIYLSEVVRKPFALSQVFFLFSEGKSAVPVKEKAPSRNGFPLSMYVVLKTRYENPKVYVRRY